MENNLLDRMDPSNASRRYNHLTEETSNLKLLTHDLNKTQSRSTQLLPRASSKGSKGRQACEALKDRAIPEQIFSKDSLRYETR